MDSDVLLRPIPACNCPVNHFLLALYYHFAEFIRNNSQQTANDSAKLSVGTYTYTINIRGDMFANNTPKHNANLPHFRTVNRTIIGNFRDCFARVI